MLIDSTARRMDAVMALFGPRSPDDALDALDAPSVLPTARPRRVAAFIGATQAAGRAARMLPARATRHAPHLAMTAPEPPRGPSTAEAFPAGGHLAPANRDHPLGRSPIHNQEEP
jgi:hypothetical protein